MNQRQCSLVLILLFSFAVIQQAICSSVYIVVSTDDACPGEFTGEPCLTLNQYVSDPLQSSNVTLKLLPGEHTIGSTLSIVGKVSFIIQGNASAIRCTMNSFSFSSIQSVYISGIAFSACRDNEIRSVVKFTIDDCSFQDSSLTLSSIRTAAIKQSSFYNLGVRTYSGANSGVLSLHRTSLRIKGCHFFNNKANRAGAAIHSSRINSYLTLTVEQCTFTNNIAFRDGAGAIYIERGAVTIRGSNFTGNRAGARDYLSAHGGALYVSSLLAFDSNFIDNRANENGGAVFMDNVGVSMSFKNCNFINNSANEKGGAMYITSIGMRSILVNNCNFTANRLHSQASLGGAVYVIGNGTSLCVRKGTFVNNTVKLGGGGAIYLHGQHIGISLVESTFSHNLASYCGVFKIDGFHHQSINFTSSNLSYNVATGIATGNNEGGVICIRNASISALNSTFKYNVAAGDAGVIQAEESRITVQGCSFDSNTAGRDGGVIFSGFYSTEISVQSSCFTNNEAGDDGGVIYMGRAGSHVEVNDTIFSCNRANDRGGAIIILGSILEIVESSFENNTADKGGVVSACNSRVTIPPGELFETNEQVFPFCILYDDKPTTGSHNATTITPPIQSNTTFHLISPDKVYIVASSYSPCPGEFTGELCFTMEQYILHPTINANVTLELQPGEHSISSSFTVTDMESFVIKGIRATLSCKSLFTLNSIRSVHISGINFTACRDKIRTRSVLNFTLESCNFHDASLSLYLTTANIMRSVFCCLRSTYGSQTVVLTVTSSSLRIENCTFFDNQAYTGGAAIRSPHSADITVEQCMFVNNVANRGDGGAIHSEGGTIVISHSSFIGNRAGYKRTIYEEYDYSGGALYVYNNEVTLKLFESNFVENRAFKNGGAVSVRNTYTHSNVSFNRCNFTYNKADNRGGAIDINGRRMSIQMNECNFVNNTLNVRGALGGAVSVNGWSNMISANKGAFINNSVRVGGGGAIYSGGSFTIISLVEMLFSHNSATYCGVLSIDGTHHRSINFTASMFTHNRATGGIIGNDTGGVICIRNASILILNDTFYHNTAAGHAGVMQVEESFVIIMESVFDGNVARHDGGVLHMNSYPNSILIYNSLFINNRAGDDGGVLYIGRAGCRVRVNESTFGFNNAASRGGAFVVLGSLLELVDSQFYNNTARFGGIASACKSEFVVSSELYMFQEQLFPFCILFDDTLLYENSTKYLVEGDHMFHVMDSETIHIVTSLTEPCPGAFTGEPCATIEQYVSDPVLSSDVTLELHPGDHRLDSTLSVSRKSSFTMQGSNTVVSCTYDSYFSFNSIQSLHINGIHFRNCKKNLISSAVNFTLENCTFQDSSIKFYDSFGLIIRNSFYGLGRRTRQKPDSGVLSFSSSLVQIERCTFTNNVATTSGVAIYSAMNSTITVKNCSFTNNVPNSNSGYLMKGGAIHSTDGIITISHSIFTRNSGRYTDYGGAVYVMRNRGVVTISSSKFINNRATDSGGAVFIQGTDHTVLFNGCLFNSSTADNRGGAVYIYGTNISLVMNECTFTESMLSSQQGLGGALYITGHSNLISVIKGSFVNNRVSRGAGGAIYAGGQHTNISLVESVLRHNTAAYCGVLIVNGTYHNMVNFHDSVFSYNSAIGGAKINDEGGVLCVSNASVYVIDSIFSHNSAVGNAGVMQIEDSNVIINASIFCNNIARRDGGVLYTKLYRINLTIHVSSFHDNEAGDDGGVIYIGRSGSQVKIIESNFSLNNAADRGGTVVVLGSILEVICSNLINNTAYSGGSISACNSIVAVSDEVFGVEESHYPFCTLYEDIANTCNDTLIPLVDYNATLDFIESDRIYITATTDSPCPGEFSGDPCLTLQQYISDPLSGSNVTLELQPGNHRVSSNISVSDKDSFIMQGSNATLFCEGRFAISSVQNANISGINFWACKENIISSVINFSVENCTFYDSSFMLTLSSATFRSSLFHYLGVGTSVGPSMGVLSLYRTTLHVERCTFSNNKAYQAGAAIHCRFATYSTILINESTFTNNIGYRTDGGAIHMEDGTITISHSNFTSNRADSQSNSYYFQRGGRGGALLVDNNFASLEVHACNFIGNKATDIGGAVYVVNAHVLYTVLFSKSTFVNNRADSKGGAVYVEGRHFSVVMNDCSFLQNQLLSRRKTSLGGAVYITNFRDSVTLSGCNFTRNSGGDGGGAMYITGMSVPIKMNKCKFNANTLTKYGALGGALFVTGTSNPIEINKGTFVNNVLSQGSGGAIYSGGRGTNVSVVDTVFSHNTAAFCGVLEVNGSHHNIMNFTASSMISNRATGRVTTIESGVGVICIRNVSFSVQNSSFSHNSVTANGGVLHVEESKVIIQQSFFEANKASGDGGVIYTNFYPSTILVHDSTFINNQAGGDGGVMYIGRANCKVRVCESSFVFNNATDRGGAFVILGSTLNITDTFINGNTANLGGAIGACNSEIIPDESSDLFSITYPMYPLSTFYNDHVDVKTTVPQYEASTKFLASDIRTMASLPQTTIVSITALRTVAQAASLPETRSKATRTVGFAPPLTETRTLHSHSEVRTTANQTRAKSIATLMDAALPTKERTITHFVNPSNTIQHTESGILSFQTEAKSLAPTIQTTVFIQTKVGTSVLQTAESTSFYTAQASTTTSDFSTMVTFTVTTLRDNQNSGGSSTTTNQNLANSSLVIVTVAEMSAHDSKNIALPITISLIIITAILVVNIVVCLILYGRWKNKQRKLLTNRFSATDNVYVTFVESKEVMKYDSKCQSEEDSF